MRIDLDDIMKFIRRTDDEHQDVLLWRWALYIQADGDTSVLSHPRGGNES